MKQTGFTSRFVTLSTLSQIFKHFHFPALYFICCTISTPLKFSNRFEQINKKVNAGKSQNITFKLLIYQDKLKVQ